MVQGEVLGRTTVSCLFSMGKYGYVLSTFKHVSNGGVVGIALSFQLLYMCFTVMKRYNKYLIVK